MSTVALLAALEVLLIFVLDLKAAWFAIGLVVIPPVFAITCCSRAQFSKRERLALALVAGLASVLAVSVAAVSMEQFVRAPSGVLSARLEHWIHALYVAGYDQWLQALYPATPGQRRQVVFMLVAVSFSWYAGSAIGAALNPRAAGEHGSGGLFDALLTTTLHRHSPDEPIHPHAAFIGAIPAAAFEWLFALLNAAGYGNG